MWPSFEKTMVSDARGSSHDRRTALPQAKFEAFARCAAAKAIFVGHRCVRRAFAAGPLRGFSPDLHGLIDPHARKPPGPDWSQRRKKSEVVWNSKTRNAFPAK